MKRPNPLWYLAAALGALTPVGVRVLCWPGHAPQEPDAVAVAAGKTLFTHEWKPGDPKAAGGDGLGPVFNATSCAACHHQGGLGGGGGLQHNVTTYVVEPRDCGQSTRQGVLHARATHKHYQETLALLDPKLPPIARPSLASLLPNGNGPRLELPAGVSLAQRNTPALFGAGAIDAIPDRVIIAEERRQRLRRGLAPVGQGEAPVGRALRLADGRVGKFGWKAQSASLLEFVQAACANELGLGNPGQAQPAPLGRPAYQPAGLDLTAQQCEQMTAFIAALPRPVQRMPADAPGRARVEEGQRLFGKIGCAECHTPSLGAVEGLYSDLLLHRMGGELVGFGGSYGASVPVMVGDSAPLPDEWRTPPLWGVAASAPYLHDGRAATLEEAIRLHGGQGGQAALRFMQLRPDEQTRLIAFLKSLGAP